MNRHRSIRIGVAAAGIMAAMLGRSTPLLAQAWTPPQGEGTVSVAYQNTFRCAHCGTVKVGIDNLYCPGDCVQCGRTLNGTEPVKRVGLYADEPAEPIALDLIQNFYAAWGHEFAGGESISGCDLTDFVGEWLEIVAEKIPALAGKAVTS